MNAVRISCSRCGSEVESAATFCPRCGASLRSAPAPAPVPVGGTPVPSTPGSPLATSPARDGRRQVPWVTGPDWAASAVIASPGARLGAWAIEWVILGSAYVVALLLAVPLVLVFSSFGAVGLIVGLFLPQIAILAVAILIIAWEGRTGKRPGTAMLGLRTVEIRTGRPPGFGRAFGRTLVLGAFGGIVVGVQGAVGGQVPTGVALALVVAMVVELVLMVLSCAWDRGPLRQGWHEKASGTTTIRLVRAAQVAYASAPVAAPIGVPVTGPAPAPVAAPVPGPSSPVAPLPGASVAPPAAPPTTPDVPAVPVASTPPAPMFGTGQGGLIADVPGFAPSPEVRPVAPGPAPRPVAPAAPVAENDDIEHTRVGVRSLAPAGPARLVFDTSEVVSAVRSGLVGRAPLGNDGELLVAIADPDRSISKTHLSFEPDPEGLWVVDLGSTNGTEVERPDRSATPVLAGERVHVPFGGTVRFGTRSFLVERG